MAKLLILDKDGTLVRPKSGGRFVQSPDDQELIPGVVEVLENTPMTVGRSRLRPTKVGLRLVSKHWRVRSRKHDMR